MDVRGGKRQRLSPGYLACFACKPAASCDELPRLQAAALRLVLGTMVQWHLGAASPAAVLSLDVVSSVAELVQSRAVVVRTLEGLKAAIADQQVATVELDTDLGGEFSAKHKPGLSQRWSSIDTALVIKRPMRLISGPGGTATIPVQVRVHTSRTEAEATALAQSGAAPTQHRRSVGGVVLIGVDARICRAITIQIRGQDGAHPVLHAEPTCPIEKNDRSILPKTGWDPFGLPIYPRRGKNSAPLRHNPGRSLEMEDDAVVDAMLEQVDIGVFEACAAEVPALNLLLGGTLYTALPEASTVSAIAQQLGGRPDSCPNYISGGDTGLLSHAARCTLMRVLDVEACNGPAANEALVDVKIDLSTAQLERLVGVDEVGQLAGLFAEPFNHQIKLRRTMSRGVPTGQGQCIPFHLDHAERTMQIPLNNPSDYEGGQLVFAMTDGQLKRFPRIAGTATVHDDGVVHGVSELRRGVRYALFLLRVPL